jgi:amino acid permease
MATTTSSVINLTKTIIGAGLLAIPYAFKADGLLWGILLILLAGVASWYGLYIVYKVSHHIEGETSFFALCAITYPKMTLLFDFSIAIQCFGVALSYLVLFGDLVPGLIGGVLTRNQVILFSLLVTIPLISFRKLDSLKFGSVVGLTAIAYLTFLVVTHALTDNLSESRGELLLWTTGKWSDVLSTFSIIIFAFTAAQNICTIINEIDDEQNTNLVIIAACGISGLLFTLVGVSGYLQFGSNVSGNVILNYDPDLLSSKLGKASLTLMVALSYPLMFHPCRISLNNMAYWIERNWSQRKKDNDHEVTPLLQDGSGHSIIHIEVPFSTNRFIIISVLLTLATYGLALSISSFELVLALVGATGSTLICFILPGLFGYKLLETKKERYWALGLTAWGILVMIASVYATLYN